MTYFYDQYEQKVYIVPESSYGVPYLSEQGAFIAPEGTYPFLRRLNIIPEGIDVPMPKILKEKLFDIGAGKHASHVASTNYEPVDIDISAVLQNPQFLGYAIGDCVTTDNAIADITDLTFISEDVMVDEDYFIIFETEADADIVAYAIIMDVASDGTSIDIDGVTNIIVEWSAANAAGVAITDQETLIDALVAEINASTAQITATKVGTTGLKLTQDQDGAVPRPIDGGTNNAALFATNINTTVGLSTHTIEERLTTLPRSFSLYCEQLNTVTAETICYWLFGCVIGEYNLEVVMDDGTIKEVVSFTCPYGVEIAYADRMINAISAMRTDDPYVWGHATASASNYLLMDVAADITPKSVEQFKLTIANNVELKGEYGVRYKKHPITGARDVILSITGFVDRNDFLGNFIEGWDSANNRPANATGNYNSVIHLIRTVDTDDIKIIIDNLLIDELDFHFMSVEEGIKSIEVSLIDAPPTQTDRKLIGAVVHNSISEIEMR